MDEKLTASTKNVIKFGDCCLTGKIQLSFLQHPPKELWKLFTDTDENSKEFCDNIIGYNNALAFMSLGGEFDRNINRGCGPWVYRLHGAMYHKTGGLLPAGDKPPCYCMLSFILWILAKHFSTEKLIIQISSRLL
jgi:hypothetical protein